MWLRPTVICCLALPVLLVPDSGLSAQGNDTAQREREWQEVLSVESSAFEVFEEELATPPAQRQQVRRRRLIAFEFAFSCVTGFLRKWIRDKDSVSYLLALFRVGLYAENCGEHPDWMEIAAKCYRRCRDHVQITNPEARWKGEPLALVVRRHLDEITARKVYPDDGGPVTDWASFEHTKGDIMIVFHTAIGESHRPLSDDEAMSIAMRRTPSKGKNLAVTLGSGLLDEADLSHYVSWRDGMVVLGVGDDPRDTDFLAEQLDEARRSYATRYFDATIAPPTLYVYANLSPAGESVGRKLSRAVHFREQAELEGYFQPLDHSVVLRRGVLVQGRWYLGTALHELVHSMIHVDFPHAPHWLDEGLASLHEEQGPSGPKDNYRLYYLLEAYEAGKFPTLDELVDPRCETWHSAKAPLLQAAARYLCFYLLEKKPESDMLRRVYTALRDDHADGQADLSSKKVLELVTGSELEALERDFRKFVVERDTDEVDRKWGLLRNGIRSYISDL